MAKKDACPFCEGFAEKNACVEQLLGKADVDFGMFGGCSLELSMVKLPFPGRAPELRAGLYNRNNSGRDFSVDIAYCPFCGKRLITEKEEG